MADTTELNKRVAAMVLKQAEVSATKEKLKNLNAELTTMKAEFLGQLKEMGQRSYECPDGSVSIRTLYSCTIPKTPEEKQALFDWLLKERGPEYYYKYVGVNSRSINSLLSKELEEAKRRGDLDFSMPGIGPRTAFETLKVGDEGNEYDKDE